VGTAEDRDYKCICVVKQLGAGALAGWLQVPRLYWIRPADLLPGLLGVQLDSWLLCSEEARDVLSGWP